MPSVQFNFTKNSNRSTHQSRAFGTWPTNQSNNPSPCTRQACSKQSGRNAKRNTRAPQSPVPSLHRPLIRLQFIQQLQGKIKSQHHLSFHQSIYLSLHTNNLFLTALIVYSQSEAGSKNRFTDDEPITLCCCCGIPLGCTTPFANALPAVDNPNWSKI